MLFCLRGDGNLRLDYSQCQWGDVILLHIPLNVNVGFRNNNNLIADLLSYSKSSYEIVEILLFSISVAVI